MSRLSAKLRGLEGDMLAFRCPGCQEYHVVSVTAGRWSWNGDVDHPTFSPSILVQSGHYAEGKQGKIGSGCWCDYNARHPSHPSPFRCRQCHCFVYDGQIRYLADCSHELAGQAVDLPDWPEENT